MYGHLHFRKFYFSPLLLPLPLPTAPPSLPLAGRRRCQPWSLLVPHRPLAFVMLILVDISCGPKPLSPRPFCPIDPSRSSRSTKERRSSGLRRGPCNRLFRFGTFSVGLQGLAASAFLALAVGVSRGCPSPNSPAEYAWNDHASGPSGGSSTKLSISIETP